MNKKELIEDYINKHPGIFSDFETQYILGYNDYEFLKEILPDLIREIYDELGLIQDEDNMFLGFRNLLDEVFSIKDKNIIEVGGGILPRLAYRINQIQTSGKITVYDPRLSIYEQDTENIKFIRKLFLSTEDVKDTDIIMGLMPSRATTAIITSAVRNNKDFMIGLSDAGLFDDFSDYYPSPEEWVDNIIRYSNRLLEREGRGKVKIKSLENYHNPFPVIYNKR